MVGEHESYTYYKTIFLRRERKGVYSYIILSIPYGSKQFGLSTSRIP